MMTCLVRGEEVVVPTREEWHTLCNEPHQVIHDRPVLSSGTVKIAMDRSLQVEAYSTDNVLAFLSLISWKNGPIWWPKMLYWPDGRPNPEDLPRDTSQAWYVRFQRFHCIDCGLDMDAYAIDRDAYPSNEQQRILTEVWPHLKGCPRCGGTLGNPLLVQIFRSHG